MTETHLSYAVLDGYLVTKCHTLIIPKRHVADYFELTFEEQKDLVQLSNFVQKRIKADFQPDGFTTGMNIGKSAGQKFPHASLHIIPRYTSACKNPSGGIRAILR